MRNHKGLGRSGGLWARLEEEQEHQKYLAAHPELQSRKKANRRALKKATNPAPKRQHPTVITTMDVPMGMTPRQRRHDNRVNWFVSCDSQSLHKAGKWITH